jgi:hypothetical protein
MLPCLIALVTWEALGKSHRPPILTLVGVLLPWLGLKTLAEHGASPDMQAAFFLAWTLPLSAALALRLYTPDAVLGFANSLRGRPRARPETDLGGVTGSPRAWPATAQETTVSSLGSPVSTS